MKLASQVTWRLATPILVTAVILLAAAWPMRLIVRWSNNASFQFDDPMLVESAQNLSSICLTRESGGPDPLILENE